MKQKTHTTICGVMIALALIGWVMVYVSASMLLAPWWRLPGIALIASSFFAGRMGRWWSGFTGLENKFVNRVVAILVAAGIGAALLIGFNFIHRPKSDTAEKRYAITRLYRTEHKQTRRVRKHTYVASGPVHYRYHVEFSLPEGGCREVQLSRERYMRLRRADSVTVAVHPGLLGIDYVTAR